MFIWAAFVIGNWVNLLCHNVALNVVFTKETERKREEGREGRKEGEKAGEREREIQTCTYTHLPPAAGLLPDCLPHQVQPKLGQSQEPESQCKSSFVE